jgi:hypothetical protein
MQRALLFLFLATLASACSGVWQPQSIPACYAPIGVPALERERSYYAALIALSERKYVIVHAEAPRQIEVEYRSNYRPDQANVHWRVDIADDAAIRVQNIPAGVSVSRKALGRQKQWFEMLSTSARRYSCRDVNWLRWEAQNRGLVPMAGGALAEQGERNSGGDVPAPAASPARVDPGAQLDRARVIELERQRNEISLVGPIATAATGLGVLAGAIALAQLAMFDCGSAYSSDEGEGCKSPKFRRNLGIGAGAMGLAAAGLIATGVTLLVRRLRATKEINRELRALSAPALVLNVDVMVESARAGLAAPGLSVSLGARF